MAGDIIRVSVPKGSDPWYVWAFWPGPDQVFRNLSSEGDTDDQCASTNGDTHGVPSWSTGGDEVCVIHSVWRTEGSEVVAIPRIVNSTAPFTAHELTALAGYQAGFVQWIPGGPMTAEELCPNP